MKETRGRKSCVRVPLNKIKFSFAQVCHMFDRAIKCMNYLGLFQALHRLGTYVYFENYKSWSFIIKTIIVTWEDKNFLANSLCSVLILNFLIYK